MSCWTRSRRAPVASASAKSARQIEGAADERAAAGANRADGDRGRDVRFADAGRADQQHAAVRARRSARWPIRRSSPCGIFGLKRPVEVGERLHRGDAGLFEPAREEPIGASGELVLDEQLEKLEMRQAARPRLGRRGRARPRPCPRGADGGGGS